MRYFLRIFIVLTVATGVFLWKSKNANAHFPISSSACFASPHYEELILEIPKINSKNQNDIRVSLEAAGGVVFVGYCEKRQMMMFDVDRDVQPTNNFLDVVLMPMGMEYFVKEGVTIKQLQYDCDLPANTSSDNNTH